MHRTMRLAPFLTTLLLGLAGCDDDSEPIDESADAPADELVELREGDLIPEACPADRQIAEVANGFCPAVTGWTRMKLFGQGAPGELANYCAYFWDDDSTPNLAAFNDVNAIVALSPDCEAVLPQNGDLMSVELGSDLEQIFHHEIGWVSPSELNLPVTEEFRAPVTVAVIDTLPYATPTAPNSRHGLDMSLIIDDIACPAGGNCQVSTVTHLGLPRVDGGSIDLIDGGYIGSHGDLARAIREAVDTWKAVNPGSKLIINLSVGWEPEPFGGESITTPATDAVLSAIRYAWCHNALVIGAAGNEGHLCEDGPLLPAGWESQPLPSATECEAMGVDVGTSPSVATYHPLIYAVSGTNHLSGAMPGSRPASGARLAAASTHAVAHGGATRTLTGTSVASAVAAGAAALLWSYDSTLSAEEVMQTLYDHGTPLTANAHFYGAGAPGTTIHKIDICSALADVCTTGCPSSIVLDCNAPAPSTPIQFSAEVASVPVTNALSFMSFSPWKVCGSCGDARIAYEYRQGGNDLAGPTCPAMVTAELPYTEPQPHDVACPTCTIDFADALVYASIDPAFDLVADPIVDVVVSVTGDNGQVDFRLGAQALDATTVTALALDPAKMPAGASRGEISITFQSSPRPVTNGLIAVDL